MARPREFDEQLAVEQAMHLFWRRGYQAASLNELLDAMHLSRSSFYETWGTKREALIEALDRYADSAMAGLIRPLTEVDAGREQIEQTLHGMVRHALSEGGTKGCLVNNCLAELAGQDIELLHRLQDIRKGLERLLVRAIRKGQADGTIDSTQSATALASFLASTFSGLNLTAKARPGKTVLNDIARAALRALDPR